MGELSTAKNGNIIIENRKKFTASGVKDVESFSPEKIVLETESATLTVTGSDMKVKKLSVETGDVFIEGQINGCVYSKERTDKEGFLKRVLR